MAENTKIQWADHTFNPWIGCSKVADGCLNCYAETLMADRYHRVIWGPRGTRRRTKTWNDPIKWNRQHETAGTVGKVFCASLADVFEDFHGSEKSDLELSGAKDLPLHNDALAPWREEMFEVIDRCPNLNFLLLTKRPENIPAMWPADGMLRENVWLGTSIASQKDDDCIYRLLASRHLSPVLFLSVEPQIGAVDLSPWLFPHPMIDWVIVGGESKQGHSEPRPFQLTWARKLVRQCHGADVPCFVKQLGSAAFDGMIPMNLIDSHGGDMREWPNDIRVRQCPEIYVTA